VPALKNLMDARNKLRDLLAKADRSEELEQTLEKILGDEAALKKLADEIKSKEG
jgi:type VI secretion system protein ImpB